MDPISNVDALVLILRQRLVERSRTATGRGTDTRAAPERPPSGADTVHALAAVQSVDDRQLGRALVQSLLADHFGAQLINEARFQQVVDRVTDTLRAEPRAARALSGAIRDLRASAR